MKYLPKRKLSQYPMYIFVYWMLAWGLVLSYETISIILNLTDDKLFVEKINNQSVTYFVPLGNEVTDIIIQTGILTGIITILVGYSWMMYVWSKVAKKI